MFVYIFYDDVSVIDNAPPLLELRFANVQLVRVKLEIVAKVRPEYVADYEFRTALKVVSYMMTYDIS